MKFEFKIYKELSKTIRKEKQMFRYIYFCWYSVAIVIWTLKLHSCSVCLLKGFFQSGTYFLTFP